MANVAGLRQPGKPGASAGARVPAVVMLRGCSRCGHRQPFPFAALGAFKSIVNPCSTALKHSRGRRRRWQQSSDGFGHGQGRGAGSGAPARGSWVRSPFSHRKPWARPQPSRGPRECRGALGLQHSSDAAEARGKAVTVEAYPPRSPSCALHPDDLAGRWKT